MSQMLWFLLRCNIPGQTRFVRHMQKRHPTTPVYVPLYNRISRPHGQRHPTTIPTPVYPGYIFVQLNPTMTSLSSILPPSPRPHYVRFNGNIAIIPDRVISNLRHKEQNNLLMIEKTIINPYQPGKRVIIHLPVTDIQAIIVKSIATHHLQVDTPFSRIIVPKAKVTVV